MFVDDGKLAVLEGDGYLLPQLKLRLFSPQAFFDTMEKGTGSTGSDTASFEVFRSKSVINLPPDSSGHRQSITMRYNPQTFLPVLPAFKSVELTGLNLALEGCVTSNDNENLSYLQKLLLQWHYKLGHLSFQHTQWIAQRGLLGKLCSFIGSTTVLPPICASCQFGGQARTPKKGSTSSSSNKGILKKDKLYPGDLVFTDQYESRVEGRHFNAQGASLSQQKFCGGTIFCDAASGRLFVQHQVGLTGEETIQAKLAFEQEAASSGVLIKHYNSDNGVYTSKRFGKALLDKGQTIKHSGVGGHHHNGVAENAIKNTVRHARTMMIHAALRWPEAAEKELWPLALSHAVFIHNHIPSMTHEQSPEDIWSGLLSSHSALVDAHPWGCPVYVLAPRLQDRGKLPKWQPRSRQGQYMGNSPLHASTVGLIRNLGTNHVSPQFHLVYDDLFETVHSGEEEIPHNWPELVVMHKFKSSYDESAWTPELAPEWLSPEEKEA